MKFTQIVSTRKRILVYRSHQVYLLGVIVKIDITFTLLVNHYQ